MQTASFDLTEWVEKYTADLFSWAFYKVSNEELARDLVQETFLAVAEKKNSFKGKSSPKTWLFSILNNKIIDYYRKKINQTIPHENETLSRFFEVEGDWKKDQRPQMWNLQQEEHLLDNDEFRDILNQCLNALPEKWSLCVKLKYLSEKKGEEICQELKISPSNYWQIIHRAKLQLRDCVGQNWFND